MAYKRIRKILPAVLTICLLLSGLSVDRLGVEAAQAGSTVTVQDHAYRYFYQQLTEPAKKLYDAMYQMYILGIFQKGEDYSLSDNGYVTAEQLRGFTMGDNQLLNDYGAARDAFQNDYPDVFYVDYSNLSIRVVQDKKGGLHGYLGIGREKSYLLAGFTAENIPGYISQYEEKIDSITFNALASSQGSTAEEAQVGYVHDYLVKNMIYKYEDQVTDPNCNARTAFDALIYGEGVCEAYTRAFKAVLDRLGIPCVCISGVYRPNERVNEEHIWNAVQMEGTWYGVDVTHDDPTNRAWTEKNSGHETREYYLVGDLDLGGHHYPSGYMSGAMFEFHYPQLGLEAYRESYFAADEDLKVKVVKGYNTEDWSEGDVLEEGTFCLSYRGKNYTQNAADGYYLIAKYFTYSPGTDTWKVSDWSYLDPWLYSYNDQETALQFEPKDAMEGLGNYLCLALPQVKKAQFAVTTIAPTFNHDMSEKELIAALKDDGAFYKGNPALLDIMTEEIENQWGGYVAPPYPKKAEPYQAGCLSIGSTYHMVFEFDDQLIAKEGEALDVLVNDAESLNTDKNACTGAQYSKIEHVSFDGVSTVSFDFTPSQMFADESCMYSLVVKGLVGQSSGKAPIPMTYLACYPCSVCAYKSQGFDWNIYGQPQLLDASGFDTDGWQAEDMDTGEVSSVDITDKISHRLTLVTTQPSEVLSNQMLDVLENSQYSDEFEKATATQTYNIKLTLCKAQIINTGQGVRVSVGFPAGTTYDDFATKGTLHFKAYHYLVDPKTNQLTGEVEEIPVTVTPYGLILTVTSFSPFTITAVEGAQTDPNSSIVLVSSENGGFQDEAGQALDGVKGTLSLKPGESKTVKVVPMDGYEIDEICINGVKQDVEDAAGVSLTLDSASLEKQSIVSATFVASAAHELEEERGEDHYVATPATITMKQKELSVETGGTLTIDPEVTTYEGEHSYQWYKDGTALAADTSKTLSVSPVAKQYAGEYQLVVTTTFHSHTVEARSEVCKVTVTDPVVQEEAGEPEPGQTQTGNDGDAGEDAAQGTEEAGGTDSPQEGQGAGGTGSPQEGQEAGGTGSPQEGQGADGAQDPQLGGGQAVPPEDGQPSQPEAGQGTDTTQESQPGDGQGTAGSADGTTPGMVPPDTPHEEFVEVQLDDGGADGASPDTSDGFEPVSIVVFLAALAMVAGALSKWRIDKRKR